VLAWPVRRDAWDVRALFFALSHKCPDVPAWVLCDGTWQIADGQHYETDFSVMV
jgi:hypothetical protein